MGILTITHRLKTTFVVSKIAQMHFDAHIDAYSCEFDHCTMSYITL